MGHHKEEEVLRWRGLVSEQVESGTSVSAFCRDRGLRDWQFYEWKKRLRKAEAARFVAIEVAASEASKQPALAQVLGIEIRHRRGWSVIVEPGLRCKSPASFAGGSGDGVVIGLPSLQALDSVPGPRIWLAAEATDMRCGFDRLD